ncbi:unnamed protein product [Brassica oleracea var. botrytis]
MPQPFGFFCISCRFAGSRNVCELSVMFSLYRGG